MTTKTPTPKPGDVCRCGHLFREHKKDRKSGLMICKVAGDDPRTVENCQGATTCKCLGFVPAIEIPTAAEFAATGERLAELTGGDLPADELTPPEALRTRDPNADEGVAGPADDSPSRKPLVTFTDGETLPPIGKDNEVGRLADVAFASGYFGDKTPAQLAILMLAGDVIDATPINALFDLDVIDGRLYYKRDPSYITARGLYEDLTAGGFAGPELPPNPPTGPGGKVVSIKFPGGQAIDLPEPVTIEPGDTIRIEGPEYAAAAEDPSVIGLRLDLSDGKISEIPPAKLEMAVPGVSRPSDEPADERPLGQAQDVAADPGPESVEARAESAATNAEPDEPRKIIQIADGTQFDVTDLVNEIKTDAATEPERSKTPVRDHIEKIQAERESELRPRDDENAADNAGNSVVDEGQTAESITGTRDDWRIEIESKLIELGFAEQKINDKLAVFDAETRDDLLRQKVVSCRALYRTRTTEMKAKAFKLLADDGKETEDQRRGFYMFCNVPVESDFWTYKHAYCVFETAGGMVK